MKNTIIKSIGFATTEHQLFALDGHNLETFDHLDKGIFDILSDEKTLHFIPEKRLASIDEARVWLYRSVLNFHTGRNFAHVILSNDGQKVLGLIDVLSPPMAKEHYQLATYPYFLEFYLKSEVQGGQIMSDILPRMIVELHRQGIHKIAAVVNRKNLAARRVLTKSGFINIGPFDDEKDHYVVDGYQYALQTQNHRHGGMD